MSKRKAKNKRERMERQAGQSAVNQVQLLRRQTKLVEAQTRMFEAATQTDFRAFRGRGASANQAMGHGGERLRAEAQWLDENDGIAIGIFDDVLDNVIGTGLRFEPMARKRNGEPAQKINDQIRDWIAKAYAFPEVTGEIPREEAERLFCRTWLRDGECFEVEHLGLIPDLPHGHGYLVEQITPEFLPYSNPVSSKSNVIHGVEMSRWGRPLAYHFTAGHAAAYGYGQTDTRPVDAARVIHVKFRRRLNQVRGQSLLHGVIPALNDVHNGLESERVAMQVASAMAAYIKRDPSMSLNAGQLAAIGDSTTGARGFDFTPGMVFDNLLPGEEVGTIGSDRPNSNLMPFVQALMSVTAAGTGTRRSSIAKDYSGSYSGNRQELVEAVIGYRRLYSYYKRQRLERHYRSLVLIGQLRGEIALTGFDPKTIHWVEIPPVALPWIDPLKEINALKAAVESEFMAKQEAIQALGRDPHVTRQLIAQEQALLAAALQESGATEPEAVAEADAVLEDGAGDEGGATQIDKGNNNANAA